MHLCSVGCLPECWWTCTGPVAKTRSSNVAEWAHMKGRIHRLRIWVFRPSRSLDGWWSVSCVSPDYISRDLVGRVGPWAHICNKHQDKHGQRIAELVTCSMTNKHHKLELRLMAKMPRLRRTKSHLAFFFFFSSSVRLWPKTLALTLA